MTHFFCACSFTGYARANITNLADMDIAQALDEADAVLVFIEIKVSTFPKYF